MNEEKTVMETQEEIDELETAAMETAEEESTEELPESDDAAENGTAEEGQEEGESGRRKKACDRPAPVSGASRRYNTTRITRRLAGRPPDNQSPNRGFQTATRKRGMSMKE